jgi:transcriptional regulator with XRE-family HTH domain
MPELEPSSPRSIGSLFQYWRKERNISQLALANEAEISPRHMSFLETGRAKPSREMVLLLASVLEVPLRERNILLLAAGFAPMYGETDLDSPDLAPVRRALDAILRQQEPYPAVVMNGVWDVVMGNRAAQRFFGFLLAPKAVPVRQNVLRMMFDPALARPYVLNWELVAEGLVERVHREALGSTQGDSLHAMLAEVLSYPGVPARLRRPKLEKPLLPVVPVRFEKDGLAFDYFSTVTTLGTPRDITLEEVRIECFFPVDRETEANARELARGD